MKTITINKVTYPVKEFDFNMMCDLSGMGVDINNLETSMLPALRAFIAICMGTNPTNAGNEMQKHLANGGNFEEAIKCFTEEIQTFFRLFGENEEAEATAEQPKKRTQSKKAE